MTAVAVWTVMVWVVLGVVQCENGDKTFEPNPYGAVYTRPGQKERFRFPDPSELRPEPPRRYSARVRSEEEEEPHTRSRRFNHGQMYFLPVRFDLNRNTFSDRSLRSDDYQQALPSPRLIMDKDFNIRFDNPYIIPLTKPLALVLDSAVNARQDGYSGEKMMIPFPVLVKARKPLLEREGFRDYRDDDEVPEHRGYDDEDPYLEDSTRKPTKKAISVRKPKKNATTTYNNSNEQKPKKVNHKPQQPSHNQMVPEGRIVNQKTNETDQTQSPLDDVLETSSVEVAPPDTYPGKIFAEMYHKIPTYPFDSIESQEFVSHKYENSPTKIYPNEMTTEDVKPLQGPRVKTANKYPINSQMFSASTDFEWVTQANSTKARNPPNEEAIKRIIIHDVLEEPLSTTTLPFVTPTATRDLTINEQYWRQI